MLDIGFQIRWVPSDRKRVWLMDDDDFVRNLGAQLLQRSKAEEEKVKKENRDFDLIALTNAGVKRIAGDLVGDESYFHGPPLGSGWAWDDLEYYYGAEISALTINDNTLQATMNKK